MTAPVDYASPSVVPARRRARRCKTCTTPPTACRTSRPTPARRSKAPPRKRSCAGPSTASVSASPSPSSMGDARARAPGGTGAARRPGDLPRHRLPLRRDARHRRRRRGDAADRPGPGAARTCRSASRTRRSARTCSPATPTCAARCARSPRWPRPSRRTSPGRPASAATRRETRSNVKVVEWDDKHQMVKVNPLAAWTHDDVAALHRRQRRSWSTRWSQRATARSAARPAPARARAAPAAGSACRRWSAACTSEDAGPRCSRQSTIPATPRSSTGSPIASSAPARPWTCVVGYLDHCAPRLADLPTDGAVVVPMLLGSTFHLTVDIPAAAPDAIIAAPLGPDRRLMDSRGRPADAGRVDAGTAGDPRRSRRSSRSQSQPSCFRSCSMSR